VHGRSSLVRLTLLISYTLYKNIVFALPEFLFAFYNGFSGRTLYDSWLITAFNLLFTSVPILAASCLDRDVPLRSALATPSLYAATASGRPRLLPWLPSAVFHGFIVFFGTTAAYGDGAGALAGGRAAGLESLGTWTAAACIAVVTAKVALATRAWSVPFAVACVASVGIFAAFVGFGGGGTGVGGELARAPMFWAGIAISVAIAIVPDFAATYVRRWYYPKEADIVAEEAARCRQKRASIDADEACGPSLVEMTAD
jgi:phospholipid-transporting ATPase